MKSKGFDKSHIFNYEIIDSLNKLVEDMEKTGGFLFYNTVSYEWLSPSEFKILYQSSRININEWDVRTTLEVLQGLIKNKIDNIIKVIKNIVLNWGDFK